MEKQTKIVKAKEMELNPAAFMQQAITQNLTPEVMEKFMNLYDRWEAKKAKKEFDLAMAAFQGECPVINKGKSVMNKPEKGGGLRYRYAPLDVIVKQVGKIISAHGLSYTINATIANNAVTAAVIVTHESGHSQESSFTAPIDADSFMNVAQKYGASLTYAKRYAFCNAFGILTGDDDTDAVANEGRESKGFINLKTAIAKTDIAGLEDYQKKMVKTDKYTPEQKAEFTKLVAARLAELTK